VAGRAEEEEVGPGDVAVGRIYDTWPDGTYRVLVDRLWPRGVRKEGAPWDLWLKEAAPSNALRAWYHANMDAYDVFRTRYRAELAAPEGRAALGRLSDAGRGRRLALVTARGDVAKSHVPVLAEALAEAAAAPE
jgi:uncharacterized protein YeaO (DUF488 family)